MSIRWNLRIALGTMAFVASCLATTEQAPGGQQVWKEYAYPASGFAVMAPKPPVEQDIDFFRTYEFGLDSGLHLRLEVSKAKQDCVAFERWARNHYPSKQQQLVVLAGHFASEQWMQLPKSTRLFLTRATCINSTQYTFAGDWPADPPAPEFDVPRPDVVTRIFDSFRIVQKESAGGESAVPGHTANGSPQSRP